MFVKIWQKTAKLRSFFLKVIFPKRCCVCNDFDSNLCVRCQSKFDLFLSYREIQDLKIFSLFNYKNKVVSQVIKTLKYKSIESLLVNLDNIIKINKDKIEAEFDFLQKSNLYYLAVPLHWRRLRERGFNQAQKIINILQLYYEGKDLSVLVKRNVYTQPQAKLNRDKRLLNLKNKFILNDISKLSDISDQAILVLVDDVVTTGSTLLNLYKLLKDEWPGVIVALTLASD